MFHQPSGFEAQLHRLDDDDVGADEVSEVERYRSFCKFGCSVLFNYGCTIFRLLSRGYPAKGCLKVS